jgi:hypothetical protein
MKKPPYFAFYETHDWYEKIPKSERATPRHKYRITKRVTSIPWPEAPGWVPSFQLDDGLIRASGGWQLVPFMGTVGTGAAESVYAISVEVDSYFDGASGPALDSGTMLPGLQHDTIFAAHRNDLLGDRTIGQSFTLKLAGDQRYGRMIEERVEYLEEIGVDLNGIEQIGKPRNLWSRGGLFFFGWPAWRKIKTRPPRNLPRPLPL